MYWEGPHHSNYIQSSLPTLSHTNCLIHQFLILMEQHFVPQVPILMEQHFAPQILILM
jgi:hypothetical protein